jgi:uroporphyrinogen decarboxylase
LRDYRWLDPIDDSRFVGVRARAAAAREAGKAVVLSGLSAGVTEVHAWLRGYLNSYTDFHLCPEIAGYILDHIADMKIAYWERMLSEVGDVVDVVIEADDLAGQHRLLFSPETCRAFVKPRHIRVFSAIKRKAPHVKILFHSCGAVRPLIGDLIEAGIDILNPVQKSAAGMDLRELKREFGRDVVFWGGGVDTQRVLPRGTPEEIRDDVRRNIEALAPGGGFVFATIHNAQADVPPQNFMAMWETLRQYGAYA